MKLSEFKEGDRLTRIERTKPRQGKSIGFGLFGEYEDVGDGSYIGDELEYIGRNESVLMFIHIQDKHEVDLCAFSWDDNGWGKYPHPLFQKAKERLKELFGKA